MSLIAVYHGFSIKLHFAARIVIFHAEPVAINSSTRRISVISPTFGFLNIKCIYLMSVNNTLIAAYAIFQYILIVSAILVEAYKDCLI